MATQTAAQFELTTSVKLAVKQMLDMLTLSYSLDLFDQGLEIFAFCKNGIIHSNAVQCLCCFLKPS